VRTSTFNIIIIIAVIIILGLLAVGESYEPDPVRWLPTYSWQDKNPYGSYAVYERLTDLFPNQTIQVSKQSFYEIYRIENEEESDFNYIAINRNLKLNRLDTETLLEYVEGGGNVLLAAESFSGSLADTLGLDNDYASFLQKDTISLRFSPAIISLSNNNFRFDKQSAESYFSKYDSSFTTILAQNENNQAILLKREIGRGNLFLCSIPQIFTNYHLLWGNQAMIRGVFAYFPQEKTIWDEYYKSGRAEQDSPFRFILSRKSLRMALYLAIFTIILYVIFEGRRKQRVIPIITPLSNRTLEFVEVIGRLYYQHQDHKNLAQKKINHFWDYLRTHHYIRTGEINEDTLEKLAAKTGMKKIEVQSLFRLIESIQTSPRIAEATLLELNRKIDKFKGVKIQKPPLTKL
jgi:hypothetical protein